MDDDTESDQPETPRPSKRLTQQIREILKRNAGNDARAREEMNELLTKMKMKAAAERSN
jgi:hypothetical protein